MHGDGDLIADFDARQIHQTGVKDDALGISHLRNRFGHDVILCFTRLLGKKNQASRGQPPSPRLWRAREVRSQRSEVRSQRSDPPMDGFAVAKISGERSDYVARSMERGAERRF